MENKPVEAMTDILHLAAFLCGDRRDIVDIDRQDDDPFVNDLVMLDVVEQRRGNASRGRCHENGGAGNPCGAIGRGFGKNLDWHRRFSHVLAHDLAALGPGRQDHERYAADGQREPAAIGNLGQVGREIGAIDDEENRQQRYGKPQLPFPQNHHHDGQQAGVDEHRAGDSDAVGRSKIARGLEGQH